MEIISGVQEYDIRRMELLVENSVDDYHPGHHPSTWLNTCAIPR